MLLNEFLKEHCRVEEQQRKLQIQENAAREQQARLARQEATISRQQQQIEALTTGLEKAYG